MQFAIVENERCSASLGLAGACPVCGSAMVAKCGDYRIHHWAHRGERNCDSWWEPEKEWHRNWKSKFPAAFREVIAFDTTGEKHIADVRTDQGIVLEFQHSHLDPQEQRAREAFHSNMVWVVDGTRLKKDLPRFIAGSAYLERRHEILYLLRNPEECFPANWLNCTVPVFFDFKGSEEVAAPDAIREFLWCLLPGRAEGLAVVGMQSRAALVQAAMSKPQILDAKGLVDAFGANIRAERAATRQPPMLHPGMPMRPRYRTARRGRSRWL